jgi:hypothetical protein
MMSLNLASNLIGSEGAKHVAEAIKVSKCVVLNHVYLTNGSTAAVCHYPQDMGALTSLNLSLNNLKVEGAKIVAEAIKVTNCAIVVILAPFSCPSDYWFNCCCLLLSTIHRLWER